MKNSSKFLIALGAGLVAGGILGILFAPDKGSETRKKLSASGKKFADKLNAKVKEGKKKVEEELSRMNGELEEAV